MDSIGQEAMSTCPPPPKKKIEKLDWRLLVSEPNVKIEQLSTPFFRFEIFNSFEMFRVFDFFSNLLLQPLGLWMESSCLASWPAAHFKDEDDDANKKDDNGNNNDRLIAEWCCTI